MQRLVNNGKYIIFGSLITILAIFGLREMTNPIWSTFFTLFYLFFFGYYAGGQILPTEKRIWQILFGSLALAGLGIIILSGVYWFYEININIVTAVLIIPPIIFAFHKTQEKDIFENVETEIDLESYAYIKSYLSTKIFVLIILVGQLMMFSVLIGRRFSDTLISPWTIMGSRFFIFFAIITLLLLWVLQKSKHSPSNLLILTTHNILMLSVALIIFKYGFGFDMHIHQATEKWILENGSILPKVPYYIGQYVLVVAGSLLTKISIYNLDKIIVPIGAGILLPAVSYFSLSRLDFKYKLIPALALIPLIPLSFFIVTTPNNFALLMAFVIGMWIWYESGTPTIQDESCTLVVRDKFGDFRTNMFGWILVFTTCAIHPFIGLPMTVIYLGSILFAKKKFRAIFYPLYFIILTLTVPATLYLNSLRQAGSITFHSFVANINNFLVIFKRPHYIFIEKGELPLQILYYYRDFIKPLCVVVIILGIFIAYKKLKLKNLGFWLTTVLGLILSSFILITSVKFANVISYDQRLYGTRLLDLGLILMIPFFVLALRQLFILIKKQSGRQFLIAIVFSALLLISWFFTYPTRDTISYYTGFNIRAADIGTVRTIDKRNEGKKDYIVLTNQTIATAALHEFSFAKYHETLQGPQYFYSIPTGGPFYQYFRKMVYEEPLKKWMVEAMQFAGVKKAYFVHTNYWAPAAEIRDAAKLEADNWWELYEGRVWVYEYLLN